MPRGSGLVKVWDVATGECVTTLRHSDRVWRGVLVLSGVISLAF